VGRHHNSTNFKPAAFQPKSARGKLARQHCPLLVDKKKQQQHFGKKNGGED